MHFSLYTIPIGILSIFLSFLSPKNEAIQTLDTPTNHVFVYVESVLDSPKVTYGNLVNRDGKYIKDSISLNPNFTYDHIEKLLLALPIERQNILFYTHGLWADKKSFYETATSILDENVFSKPDQKYGVVVSLQWHGTINYIKDYEITSEAGKILAPTYMELSRILKGINPDGKIAHLGHSMGHQVMYSMLASSYRADPSLTVDQFMFCAADIRDTILQDSIMNYYVKNSDHTVVFHNHNDRTLKMASFAVEGDRLGILGPKIEASKALPSQVEIIDVSAYDDFESRPGQMSLHRYFYDSPKARTDLLNILSR